jgi:hypothetical protein
MTHSAAPRQHAAMSRTFWTPGCVNLIGEYTDLVARLGASFCPSFRTASASGPTALRQPRAVVSHVRGLCKSPARRGFCVSVQSRPRPEQPLVEPILEPSRGEARVSRQGPAPGAAKRTGVERSEAEAIYAHGRDPVVEVLLALSARLEAQDAQLSKLAERVGELEQRLKRDSHNSSLPPSQDPPGAAKRGRSRGTGRKRGAQPGHAGHGRSLFPIERVSRGGRPLAAALQLRPRLWRG